MSRVSNVDRVGGFASPVESRLILSRHGRVLSTDHLITNLVLHKAWTYGVTIVWRVADVMSLAQCDVFLQTEYTASVDSFKSGRATVDV